MRLTFWKNFLFRREQTIAFFKSVFNSLFNWKSH